MILFLQDWKRYPNAIVHTSTKNKSFVRLAQLYKQMGVKNYFFHLALMTPEIAELDPHSEDLTEDEKFLIGRECRENIWYYLREVVRIPAGGKGVSYIANRGNISMTWLYMNHIDVALIQPRQTGKSVSTDAVMVWLMFIATSGYNIALFTKDDRLRVANIDRLKRMRDILPAYLNPTNKSDANNQSVITCNALDNTYLTAVAQNSETQANNVLRGNTLPTVQIDEGPFISYAGTSIPAILAATTKARETAAADGLPYGNIFTTTAGKKDDRDGRYMYDIISNGAVWTESFYDVYGEKDLVEAVEHACRAVKGKPKKIIVNCTFSHKQLGYTDEWLYKVISLVGGDKDSINRDFFNVWTSGTQGSPLSVALNEAILKSEKDPLETEFFEGGYAIRWYVPKEQMQLGQYTIGLDTSEAIDGDDIGMVVTDNRDLSVVAAGTFNETNIINFSIFIGKFLIKYTNTLLVIERKSTGTSIVAKLVLLLPEHGVDPFKRIFNRVFENQHERKEDFGLCTQDLNRRRPTFYDKYIKDFGFVTGPENRSQLYGPVLQNAAKKAGHLVRDKTLSNQIRGLVVKKGRIDHSSGNHDDMVIGWLLTHWFLSEARYLDSYGIDISKVMCMMANSAQDMTAEEILERRKQVLIKKEIDDIIEKLGTITDEFLIIGFEQKLMHLVSKLNETNSTPLSFQELINNVNEKRKLKNKIRSRSGNQKGLIKPRWSNEGVDYVARAWAA